MAKDRPQRREGTGRATTDRAVDLGSGDARDAEAAPDRKNRDFKGLRAKRKSIQNFVQSDLAVDEHGFEDFDAYLNHGKGGSSASASSSDLVDLKARPSVVKSAGSPRKAASKWSPGRRSPPRVVKGTAGGSPKVSPNANLRRSARLSGAKTKRRRGRDGGDGDDDDELVDGEADNDDGFTPVKAVDSPIAIGGGTPASGAAGSARRQWRRAAAKTVPSRPSVRGSPSGGKVRTTGGRRRRKDADRSKKRSSDRRRRRSVVSPMAAMSGHVDTPKKLLTFSDSGDNAPATGSRRRPQSRRKPGSSKAKGSRKSKGNKKRSKRDRRYGEGMDRLTAAAAAAQRGASPVESLKIRPPPGSAVRGRRGGRDYHEASGVAKPTAAGSSSSSPSSSFNLDNLSEMSPSFTPSVLPDPDFEPSEDEDASLSSAPPASSSESSPMPDVSDTDSEGAGPTPARGLERGDRARVKPLEFWRNEVPVYERRLGDVTLVDIVRGASPEITASGKKKPRGSKRGRDDDLPEAKRVKVRDRLGTYDDKFLEEAAVEVPTRDGGAGAAIVPVRAAGQLVLKAIGEGTTDDGVDGGGGDGAFKFGLAFTSSLWKSGVLALEPGQSKPAQVSSKYTEVFMVQRGEVEFSVGNKVYLLGADSQFYVPPGVTYSLSNPIDRDGDETTTTAVIAFVAIKGEAAVGQPSNVVVSPA